MKQQTFSDIEYSGRKRVTKREEFLNIMDEIIPWEEWVEYIVPHYPAGKRGRPPKGIEKMLRMYLLQSWFNLSDEGVEDAIYDSYAMRKFMGINFFEEQAPDSTTLLKFRHLIEKNKIAEQFFEAIKYVIEKSGYMMRGGSIIDATIISAPSSIKNAGKARDPEMHQTKKGNEWHFGMKCHIGVCAASGFVHSVEATSAKVHDIVIASKLIRDDDEVVYGDSGFLGIEKREEIKADEHLSKIEYRINKRPSQLPKISGNFINWDRYIEYRKSSIRSKIEHAFKIIKVEFGYRKTVYRGIAKNLNRLFMLFASSNLLMCARAGRKLIPITG